MKQIKFFAAVFLSVWLISCQQSAKESTNETATDSLSEIQYDTVSLAETSDTLKDTSVQDSHSSSNNTVDKSQDFTIREGTHNLSLQWISWEEMGKAEIKYIGNNTYSIVGEQRNKENSDYLKIKGTLEPISDKELIFDGTVEHQITHLNQGQPCVKNGIQTFKSTKNRQYWRMQDMQNCEGGRVTDYIDIYF